MADMLIAHIPVTPVAHALGDVTLATLHADTARARAIADKRLVVLTRKQFDAPLEYSASNPTGVTVGKQWKARRGKHIPASSTDPAHFVVHEYIECPDGPTCPYRKQYAHANGDHIHITTGDVELIQESSL